MDSVVDPIFYLPAEEFFQSYARLGLTYDDVSLATRYSEILPKDTKLDVSLSERLRLHIPVVSADMDTVTESKMAIGMAHNGGLGIIHYNMSEKTQIKEVARVKNHIHGLIQEPIKVAPNQSISDVLELCEQKQFEFRTFPVVGANGKLLGLLPGRVVRERYANKQVHEAMMPRQDVATILEEQLGENPIQAADEFFNENMGIHKLLVVDNEDVLRGLFTLSDVERIAQEAAASVKPARDAKFRLVCGAAISAARTATGQLDRDRIVGHVSALVNEGLDAVAVSTAHGFSQGVGDAVKLLRQEFKDLTIIAGNVTTGEGVTFLAEAGADAIKVGQGPGSICTTRIVAGVGVPQLTALYVASREAAKKGVSIIADGGITKSGDMVKALTLADAVMCGGLLASCPEAPGRILEINGKLYKQYRGMGSLAAMKAGSAARYGHDKKDNSAKVTAEGIEALKEISGSLEKTLRQLVGGIQSGMGYLGAKDLPCMKERALYIRVTNAGLKEASPHDVVEVKTSKDEME